MVIAETVPGSRLWLCRDFQMLLGHGKNLQAAPMSEGRMSHYFLPLAPPILLVEPLRDVLSLHAIHCSRISLDTCLFPYVVRSSDRMQSLRIHRIVRAFGHTLLLNFYRCNKWWGCWWLLMDLGAFWIVVVCDLHYRISSKKTVGSELRFFCDAAISLSFCWSLADYCGHEVLLMNGKANCCAGIVVAAPKNACAAIGLTTDQWSVSGSNIWSDLVVRSVREVPVAVHALDWGVMRRKCWLVRNILFLKKGFLGVDDSMQLRQQCLVGYLVVWCAYDDYKGPGTGWYHFSHEFDFGGVWLVVWAELVRGVHYMRA